MLNSSWNIHAHTAAPIATGTTVRMMVFLSSRAISGPAI